MERLSIGIFVFFVLTSTTLGQQPGSKCENSEAAAKKAAKVVGDLAIKLHQQIGKPEDNIVFAPASIAVALALLESGAVGTTKEEIEALIGSKDFKDSSALYQSLQSSAQLNIGHGLFYSNLLQIKPEYLAMEDCFQAEILPRPFKTAPEVARSQINRWALSQSSRVKELFVEGTIDKSTRIVLAGAPYLSAVWPEEMNVVRSSFYRFGKNDQAQMIDFMAHQGEYGYYSGDQFDALELPFSDVPFHLYVILPKQRDGLAAVEKSLTGDQVIGLADVVKLQPVSLKIPHFAIRQSIDLAAVLAKLGVEQVFSDQADLSRMVDKDKAKISKAVHEVYFKLNEDGADSVVETEAETAHGSNVVVPKPPEPSKAFVADHPFVFAIMHKPTGAIVFMGRVNSIDKQD